MTITEIKAALAKIGGSANKHLGQHFLIDQQVLAEIIEAAEIKKGDRVLEIGPGLGVLTRELIKCGADVIAIEKDRRLAEYTFNSFPSFDGGKVSSSTRRIEGIFGDAAKLDWDQFVGDKPWKFVSNLPYAITSLALRKALYAKNPPEVVVVLVQREVAERVLARDGKMSLLALMVGLAVGPVETQNLASNSKQSNPNNPNIQIIRRVPAEAFYPPPKVESAILKIIPMSHEPRVTLWGIEPEDVMKLAKKGFAHPRKLVQRNLEIANSKWQELSSQIGFEIKARAEDLTAKQWAELAKLV
ncbi:MAG: rRNA adenine dimethyltransferase family protein [Patescibacteria group bacterium]|jgi:16S rRNA (adenine1518-N6/adenine1519-N6)-dimethyltransferase